MIFANQSRGLGHRAQYAVFDGQATEEIAGDVHTRPSDALVDGLHDVCVPKSG